MLSLYSAQAELENSVPKNSQLRFGLFTRHLLYPPNAMPKTGHCFVRKAAQFQHKYVFDLFQPGKIVI
jgi:hypothetical protein